MVARIRDFLIQIRFDGDSASLVLHSEYDSEHDCDEMVNALARFLLSHADEPYLLMRLASYDNFGGYAYQSICAFLRSGSH